MHVNVQDTTPKIWTTFVVLLEMNNFDAEFLTNSKNIIFCNLKIKVNLS